MKVHKLVFSSALIALGVLLSQIVKFPVGPAICAPIQHLINVLSAVFLGPLYAVINAFLISLIRNLMGSGTLLAFPGSMVGALLAGYAYCLSKKLSLAMLGEVLGTGILGSILAFPVARWILGKDVLALFFMPSFLISSLAGALMAWMMVPVLKTSRLSH